MEQTQPRLIWLDYRKAAADAELLTNLSAVAVAGAFLWTASDEGRTIECLEDLLRAVDRLPMEGIAEGPAAEEHGA